MLILIIFHDSWRNSLGGEIQWLTSTAWNNNRMLNSLLCYNNVGFFQYEGHWTGFYRFEMIKSIEIVTILFSILNKTVKLNMLEC